MGYSTFIEESLERLRQEFEATRNKLIVWKAYRISQRFRDAAGSRLPVPEWILAAFDDDAERLTRIGEDATSWSPGFDWQSATLESFGFQASPRGGPSNPYRVGARDNDRYRFAVHMRVLIDGDGQQETYAAEEVARRWGINASTVRRAWKQFGSIVRNENLEEQVWTVVAASPQFVKLFGWRGLAFYGKKPIREILEQLTAVELWQLLMNDEAADYLTS